MSYGKMIRNWREKLGWTQRQLADEIGYTDGYIAHLENEAKLPSLKICIALEGVFQLTPEERQKLLQSVEDVRQRRAEQRIHKQDSVLRSVIRTRGAGRAVRTQGSAVTRTRGSVSGPVDEASSEELSSEDIAHDLADDPDLRAAYQYLRTALGDPEMREAVLTALRSFAQTVESQSRQSATSE